MQGYIHVDIGSSFIELCIFLFFCNLLLAFNIQDFICMCNWGNQTTQGVWYFSARSDWERLSTFISKFHPVRGYFLCVQCKDTQTFCACLSLKPGQEASSMITWLAVPLFPMQASQNWGTLYQTHPPPSESRSACPFATSQTTSFFQNVTITSISQHTQSWQCTQVHQALTRSQFKSSNNNVQILM
jgi:hypothetical protein